MRQVVFAVSVIEPQGGENGLQTIIYERSYTDLKN